MKRRFLKKWIEDILTFIFMLNFVLLVSINDFTSIKAFLGIGIIIAINVLIWNVLKRYGKNFTCFN